MICQIDIIKEGTGKKLFTVSGKFENQKMALDAGNKMIEAFHIKQGKVLVSYGFGDEIIRRLDTIIELIKEEK